MRELLKAKSSRGGPGRPRSTEEVLDGQDLLRGGPDGQDLTRGGPTARIQYEEVLGLSLQKTKGWSFAKTTPREVVRVVFVKRPGAGLYKNAKEEVVVSGLD